MQNLDVKDAAFQLAGVNAIVQVALAVLESGRQGADERTCRFRGTRPRSSGAAVQLARLSSDGRTIEPGGPDVRRA